MYRVVLEGTDNTRDLGGYMTTCNKTVKKNLLFRSDRFDKITKEEAVKMIEAKTPKRKAAKKSSTKKKATKKK